MCCIANVIAENIKKAIKGIWIYGVMVLFMWQSASARQEPRISFQSLQEGLSNQVITCILKDYKGYMWFGTHSGLNRYDGTNFVIYETHSAESRDISHNLIGAIAEDVNHNLWVGTASGLNRYNRDTDRFEAITVSGKLLNIRSLFCDQQGLVWIGTAGDGLFVYNPFSKKLTNYRHNPENPHSIRSNFVKAITADKQQNLWIGTRDGLELLSPGKKTFTHFVASKDSTGLSHNAINALLPEADGSLWIGTYGGGLNRLIRKKDGYYFKHFQKSKHSGSLSNDFVLSLLKDKRGNLWIGTENGGLNCLVPQADDFIHYMSQDGNPQSLSSNSIWSLYEDANGLLWIGTYYKGLNIYDASFEIFQSYQRNGFQKQTLVSNQVRGYAEDESGNLWIATDGGGINYFDTQTKQFSEPISNDRLLSKAVLAILYDASRTVWVGTWGGGVERFDKKGNKLGTYQFDGKNKNGRYNVNCLYEDKAGRIWAGTSGNGLFLYNPKMNCFDQIEDLSGQSHFSVNAYVNAILEDRDNQLWIGTAYGLLCLKPNADGSYAFFEYLYNEATKGKDVFAVTTLYVDSQGRLWIGTSDNLTLCNPVQRTFASYSKQDGLPSSTINGITEDRAGNLWLSTNKGLSRFEQSSRSFKNFSKEDGLTTNEFYSNACIKTCKGELFFGGNNGMIAFCPSRIVTNQYIPPVYITEFNLFNTPVKIGTPDSPLKKSISETTDITLDYQQTSFSIEFVALNFTHSARNQYAYKLEGFDKDWNQVGTRRMATYTNLDAGTYVFKVKGSNNELLWNQTPTTLRITILPPWWATGWAYLLYAVVVFTLLWVFVQLKLNQIRQEQKLKLEQLHRIKNEELHKMKVQFFTNVSHELRTPLTLILSPLEQIITHHSLKGELKNKINLVYNNAERLFGLVNELMDFTKLEESQLKLHVRQSDIGKYIHDLYVLFADQAHERQIDYQFVCEAENTEAWFDKSKMEKIVLNLIANAFKFTPDGGTIRVSLEDADEHIKIAVTDNGSGISPQYVDKVFDRFFQSPEEETRYNMGTGIGLALVKNFVELHHGTIAVNSERGVRTCFEVCLPLGNAHFTPDEIITDEQAANAGLINTLPVVNSVKTALPQAPLVLVVEDNFTLRAYLASVLSAKYRILEASDGEMGLKMALEYTPDLIISDIVMPRCSGTELCKLVKTDTRLSHIPVILLTAKATTDDQIEGVQTGADAYITKPFNIQLLSTQIDQLIQVRRELCAHFSQEVYLRPDKLAEATHEMDQQFLQRITDYILKNLADNNLTVEALADTVNLSRSNMYRKIKALTGQSAIEFIRIIRLKQALKLMETQKHSLAEVAYLTGFTSPAYFTKTFKDHYGKPPSEYLKN